MSLPWNPPVYPDFSICHADYGERLLIADCIQAALAIPRDMSLDRPSSLRIVQYDIDPFRINMPQTLPIHKNAGELHQYAPSDEILRLILHLR